MGIKYWQFIPLLFEWSSDRDYDPCPLRDNYQLVRNILAACINNEVIDQRVMIVMAAIINAMLLAGERARSNSLTGSFMYISKTMRM